MIHKALNHAVGRQLIYHNPADYVVLPKVIQPDIRTLTEEEIKQFIAAMEGEPKTVLKISETKTSKGTRQIPLLPEVAEKVLTHIQRQKEQAARSYGMYEDTPYLVANELGHYLDPGTVRKKLKGLVLRTSTLTVCVILMLRKQ